MNDDIDLKIKMGKRIEIIRKDMKKTKEEFSRELGITPQYLGIVESGKSALSYSKLERLCNISNLSSDYIVFGKEIDLEEKTKMLLNEYSYSEIQEACEAIKQIAIFMKDMKNKK